MSWPFTINMFALAILFGVWQGSIAAGAFAFFVANFAVVYKRNQ
jgi:hypothetical protein